MSEEIGRVTEAAALQDAEKVAFLHSILDEARRTDKWEGELRRGPTGPPLGFTVVSRHLTESERIARLRADEARDELTKSLNVQRLLAVLDDTFIGAGGQLDPTRTERGAEVGAE